MSYEENALVWLFKRIQNEIQEDTYTVTINGTISQPDKRLQQSFMMKKFSGWVTHDTQLCLHIIW